MAFNPENQYRATIIRGKAKSDMDNLLPAYAQILNTICPCPTESFPRQFNSQLQRFLHIASVKTLNNHRTEIAGKLFGMFYHDRSGNVQISDRTKKLIADQDQPAFFKDICYKFQFPNGMDKIGKIRAHISNGIKIRQCSFILELMKQAQRAGATLTVLEIGYYVLNALEVLRGDVAPHLVLEIILQRRTQGIFRRVPAGSYGSQHINETINYLELANLIRRDGQQIVLNAGESRAIDFIASQWNAPLLFDIKRENTESLQKRKELYMTWEEYYSKAGVPGDVLHTPLESLVAAPAPLTGGSGETIELGDEGEAYVYKYERDRVAAFNPRLVNRVLLLGKTKGLGFDVQSVRAQRGAHSDHAIYIEVKSTKRVTMPDPEGLWSDTITLTRTEWLAAEQHRQAYSLFRVYFTPAGTRIFTINDPVTKSETELIHAAPLSYRVDFTKDAGDFLN